VSGAKASVSEIATGPGQSPALNVNQLSDLSLPTFLLVAGIAVLEFQHRMILRELTGEEVAVTTVGRVIPA